MFEQQVEACGTEEYPWVFFYGEIASMTSKTSAAGISILSNILLVILKLIVGTITGSVSILAEAIHSGVDLIAAIVAYFSVRIADQPPDEDHTFGHGKYENISGTIEALLIIFAAVYIGYEAVSRIVSHARVERLGFGLVVMLISAVSNWIVSANLFKVARETDSIALEADGHHLRLDVYTSLAILVGLFIVYLTDISLIDQLLGIGVALWIGWIGWQLSVKAIGPLLDLQLPPDEIDRIISILESEELVCGFHKLRTRKAGAHRHIDVHLLLPDEMSLYEAHALAERVEDKIRVEFDNVHILTHVEPESD